MTASRLDYAKRTRGSASVLTRAGWVFAFVALAIWMVYLVQDYEFRRHMIGDEDANHFELVGLTRTLRFAAISSFIGAISSLASLCGLRRSTSAWGAFILNIGMLLGSLVWRG